MAKIWLLCVCVASIAALAWWWLGSRGERLDPPQVLQERVLEGGSVEVQSQAARDMVRYPEGQQTRPFVHRALDEYRGNNPDVLVPLVQGVLKQRDWQSMPRLLELMDHPDPRVRGKAGAAVSVIMGADYGFHAEDPPETRREVLERIRSVHKNMYSEIERFYSAREQK